MLSTIDTSPIISALERGCVEIASVRFQAKVPGVSSYDEANPWRRVSSILACPEVYGTLGISSLSIEAPAQFRHACGFEVIGTVANLLTLGGFHRDFVESSGEALAIARECLDPVFLGSRRYRGLEAYSSGQAWCPWFIGEVLDATILLGYGAEWWLLTVTGTD